MEQIFKSSTIEVTFLVIGGGIAGVSCAESLAFNCPNDKILLMTESNIIKTITDLEFVARYLPKFNIHEQILPNNNVSTNVQCKISPAILTLVDQLKHINTNDCYVLTKNERKIHYRYLSICTGGRSRLIADNNPLVIGIRDTESVLDLQKHLLTCRRIVVVGNGGIASELIHELKSLEIHWVVKDNHITSTFLDPGAACFFQQYLKHQDDANCDSMQVKPKPFIKRLCYNELQPSTSDCVSFGPALGPDWHQHFELKCSPDHRKNLIIHFKAYIAGVSNFEEFGKSGLIVTLTTGEEIKCDFLVSATGVTPRLDFTCEPSFDIDEKDGGIRVNEMMKTSIDNIYAAGDVCTCAWQLPDIWFQMRLWTQARQMGVMAARSMAASLQGEQIYSDFSFELFGHVTQLFGFSVILLGCYNGQNLGTNYEILLRSTPGIEYIKFVLQDGRLRGALLVGNTELAETCENLILNGIDLTPYGNHILNPDFDIDDFFD